MNRSTPTVTTTQKVPGYAILDLRTSQLQTQVTVATASPATQITRAAGTLGDFFIRYVRARSSPARVLYTGLAGLFGVFGAALLGVEFAASGTGAAWAVQAKITGLDTVQMAVMGAACLGLGGLAVHAYRFTERGRQEDKAWLMKTSQDQALPAELRARATGALLDQLGAPSAGTVRNGPEGTT